MDINKLCPGCMNINAEGGKCPVCGYNGEENGKDLLAVRYILSGRYIIGKVISVTCESVLYTAYDNLEEKAVNIKEYFPENIAVRAYDGKVDVAPEKAEVFKEGLAAFCDLNKKLMPLDLPSLAATLSVFEANGTAYAVLAAVVGITLKEFLNKNGGSLKWEQARPLFLPLIDTVNSLNKAGIVHGGISPESIIVGRDGRMRLGEILISRVRRADKQMTAQIYAGYAAVEQYDPAAFEIGEYTDVYALSATLFRVLIGTVPDESVKRMENDELSIPSHFAGELPRQVLVAMANGLQILPENRTETVERFRDELVYGETRESMMQTEAPVKKQKSKNKPDKKEKGVNKKKDKEMPAREEKENTEKPDPSEKKRNVKVWLITVLSTVLVFAAVAAVLVFGVFKDRIFKPESTVTSSESDSMPIIASIGDYDSSAVASVPTFEVPNVLGRTLASISSGEQYERFRFKLEKKVYSTVFPKGVICEQSVKSGTFVENGTEINVTVSLGPRDFQMPSVTGVSELAAKVQLLRLGILYENIELVEKYDSEKDPAIIIDQSPAAGETVNEDSKVRIYINSYEGNRNEDESN